MHEEQLRQAITTIRQLRADLRTAQQEAKTATQTCVPIAITGIGCRLPGGANSAEAFADLLEAGADMVVGTPASRWNAEEWFDPDPDVPGRICSKRGAFLADIDQFDAGFFEMSDREAVEMDPQHRLLLITAWEALERAAIAPASLAGTRTGVYVGINGAEYYQNGIADPALITAHTLSGGVASAAAGRIAYQFDLAGPAVAIDTACSSSLAAVHHACRALRSGEIDMALSGGVYVVLDPNLSVGLSRLRMLAPDGQCKPFDADANGFVQGEGAGMIVLKRLDDAQRDGDPVLGVIRGSAMNQDGRSVSLTAPSRDAQRRVILNALEDANADPKDVRYVETHGTGTALGDPIEAHALSDVFGAQRDSLMLGAVKSNIGHLGPAAGIAGLIKTVEVLRRGVVPGNLHFNRLNPQIDTGALRLDFPQSPTRLADAGDGGKYLAGVSSFGFAGTNVHLVLGPTPDLEKAASDRDAPPALLCLSARSVMALENLRGQMIDYLATAPDFAAVCRSAARGRAAMEHRLYVVANTAQAALAPLKSAPLLAPRPRARLAVACGERSEGLIDTLRQVGIQPHVLIGQNVAKGSVPVLSRNDVQTATTLLEMKVTAVLCADLSDLPQGIDTGIRVLTKPSVTSKDRLDLIGHLFTLGFHPDPKGFITPGPRIAVPVTPMEPYATWRPRSTGGNSVSTLPGADMSGPPPDARYRLVTGLRRHPWLGDHRVNGQALVPGAFQIATMLAALRKTHPNAEGLRDIAFTHPFALDEQGDHEVWTVCDQTGGVRLTSRRLGPAQDQASWVKHAQADHLEPSTATLSKPQTDLAPNAPKLAAADWRKELAAMGIELGPAFSGLAWMQRHGGRARASVAPVDGKMVLDEMIHPAFLDACFQSAGGTLPKDLRDTALLPIGIERFRQFALPSGPVTVEAKGRQEGETVIVDLWVLDDAGHVLVEVEGLSVRPLITGDNSPRSDLFQLKDVSQNPPAKSVTGKRLLIASDETVAASLAPEVLASDQLVLTPDPTAFDMYEQIAFVVDADCSAQMLADIVACTSVIANLEPPPQVVFGALGPPSARGEALAGLAATLRMEQPLTNARFVRAQNDSILIEELGVPSDEDRVQRTDGHRTVSRLCPLNSTPTDAPQLSGTVMITGGFGGLGRSLARWVITRGASAIVLVGRHPNEEFTSHLAQQSGCHIVSCAVDIGTSDGIAAVLAALDGLPPIEAIYHAAGAQAPSLMRDLTASQFAKAFDGKAEGAIMLDHATRSMGVREFVMISSVAAVLGAAGQGGYSAANAALDGIALERRAAGLPAISLRLGRMGDAGMATDLSDNARARIDAMGLKPMTIPAILDGVVAALARGVACPILADVDWRSFAARHPTGSMPPMLSDVVQADEVTAESDTAEDHFSTAIRAIAALSPQATIDEERTLVQLGFDSLMAIELRTRLRKTFGISPSIADILGTATIAELRRATTPDIEPSGEDEWENLVL